MKSLILSLLFVASGFFLLFTQKVEAGHPEHGRFKGFPQVVDGDSLILEGEEFRILCIDAVELHQTCQNARKEPYPCGIEAKKALQTLIGGQKVACYGHERDVYNRPLVHCYRGSMDLGQEMVKEGWAVGTCASTKKEAKKAKAEKLGIWQGRFLNPKTWRKQHPWHKSGENN